MFTSSRVSFVQRFLVTAAALVLLAPILVHFSLRCINTMFNTPHLWIPESNEQRREFDWFVASFESPALVIISWPDCNVDDPRLPDLAAALSNPEHPHYQTDSAELFDRIVTGNSVVQQLTAAPLRLTHAQAVHRLRGVLVGKDDRSSCAVVVFSEMGGYQRSKALETLLTTACDVCGVEPAAIHVAGPPVDGSAIDKAGVNTLIWCAPPSALLSLFLCWWCLGSWRYAVTNLAAAAAGEGLCLTLVYASGVPMNAILILMPPLVFVLTIAAGVHLVNYYLDEVNSGSIANAPQRAMRLGWSPCALATATTAIGLCSLIVSSVEPIRVFGGFAAIGVVVTLLLLFLLLPGVLELWGITSCRGRYLPRVERAWLQRIWQSLADWIIQRSMTVSAVGVVLILALGWGLMSVQTSVQLRDLFSPRDRILADYAWLEENLGPTVPVEVVVHFPADSALSFQDRVNLVGAVANRVKEIDGIEGVMSAATFSPTQQRGSSVGRLVRRIAQEKISLRRFSDARYLHQDDQRQSWRVAARVGALNELDYEVFLEELKDRIVPLIREFAVHEKGSVELTVTGALPLIYQTQRILLSDLIKSFVAAFAIVGVVMMIVLKSVRAGLLAMIPNAFPTAAVFGLMGWMDVPIDIGTLMTASIALGIAVVDTLHFLTCFRREVSAGYSTHDAVRRSFARCANAIVQTSIICGVGMLVFVFSTFMPASRFAWMVFVLLMAALVGDLLILPALLSGPLGKLFVKQQAQGGARQGEAAAAANIA